MITINLMPRPVDATLLEALRGVGTNDIGHLRYWGMMSPRLRPVTAGARIVGTAVTVIAPATDSAMIPHVLGLVRPGDVLVIDRLGDRLHACLGSVVTLAANIAGLAGIIVDGYATDFDEIREQGFPLWCRGEAAAMSKLQATAGAINIPVSCGGVAVTPGDAVLADAHGICVLPAQEIGPLVASIAAAAQKRPARIARLQAGEKLGDVNGISAKIAAALKG